ncbi:hypothetical protein D9M68_923680 [compost metagenome]
MKHPHRRKHRARAYQWLATTVNGVNKVTGHLGVVGSLGINLKLIRATRQRASKNVQAIGITVGDDEDVEDALWRVVGAGADDRLPLVRLDQRRNFHGDTGVIINCRHYGMNGANVCLCGKRIALSDKPKRHVYQMCAVVP